jgi:hypothetical protein
MRAFPVGRWVNDPRHEGPQCLEPLFRHLLGSYWHEWGERDFCGGEDPGRGVGACLRTGPVRGHAGAAPEGRQAMKAILLPNGRLLIPRPPEDVDEPEGPPVQEIGPEHPDFAGWLATAEPGEDPSAQGERPQMTVCPPAAFRCLACHFRRAGLVAGESGL